MHAPGAGRAGQAGRWPDRNAARVLPDPVGATTSTSWSWADGVPGADLSLGVARQRRPRTSLGQGPRTASPSAAVGCRRHPSMLLGPGPDKRAPEQAAQAAPSGPREVGRDGDVGRRRHAHALLSADRGAGGQGLDVGGGRGLPAMPPKSPALLTSSTMTQSDRAHVLALDRHHGLGPGSRRSAASTARPRTRPLDDFVDVSGMGLLTS